MTREERRQLADHLVFVGEIEPCSVWEWLVLTKGNLILSSAVLKEFKEKISE